MALSAKETKGIGGTKASTSHGKDIIYEVGMASQAPVKRLLVVEDDPDQSSAVRDRLELYGYAVTCAQDGRTAMEILQTDSFDGVLLDMNLPQIPGVEVLAATRHVLPHVPVVVMSASSSRLRAAKELQLACGYIEKPFGTDQFKQAVHGCFGPADRQDL